MGEEPYGQTLSEVEKRAYDQVGAAIPTEVANQFLTYLGLFGLFPHLNNEGNSP